MNITTLSRLALSAAIVFSLRPCAAQQAGPATLTIDPAQIISPVSPTLYGLMTEEINHSYDGGLYAEMVRNRTVRGSWAGPEAWTVVQRGNAAASMSEDRETGPSKALPYSVKVTVDSATPTDPAGLANSGWWGMAVRPHTTYRGSLYAKVASDMGPLTAKLINDATGEVLAKAEVPSAYRRLVAL